MNEVLSIVVGAAAGPIALGFISAVVHRRYERVGASLGVLSNCGQTLKISVLAYIPHIVMAAIGCLLVGNGIWTWVHLGKRGEFLIVFGVVLFYYGVGKCKGLYPLNLRVSDSGLEYVNGTDSFKLMFKDINKTELIRKHLGGYISITTTVDKKLLLPLTFRKGPRLYNTLLEYSCVKSDGP